ncbi:hypothetical protein GCM10023220_35470 [Streptomyces ziwulingensis]|uniref:Uncharacterized protein n=1 Tax=Streptomyces ziwulingensis TaxID=1045501 RepID=A0ABP9C2K6_9ACTN
MLENIRPRYSQNFHRYQPCPAWLSAPAETEAPVSLPETTVPVEVPTTSSSTTVTLFSKETTLVSPVFHVMVFVLAEELSRVRQEAAGAGNRVTVSP